MATEEEEELLLEKAYADLAKAIVANTPRPKEAG